MADSSVVQSVPAVAAWAVLLGALALFAWLGVTARATRDRGQPAPPRSPSSNLESSFRMRKRIDQTRGARGSEGGRRGARDGGGAGSAGSAGSAGGAGGAGGADALDDYVTARNSQTALTLAVSFLASGMGAWILFVPPEIGAFVGVDGVIGYALAAGAPFVALALAGPRLRRALPHGRSLSEFAKLRFGSGFHLAVTAISVLYMLTFLTAELTAVGGLAAQLTGLPGDAVIVLVAAVTLAYTTVGGLRASLRTDTWQGWLILALLLVSAAAAIGGLADAADAWSGSGLLGVDRVGVEVALTLVIAVTAANLFHQGYWQRAWAARDDGALRRGGLLGAALTLPVMLLVGGLGVLAAGAGLDLGQPPAPLFALIAGLGPAVGLVVFVLGVALVASSVDTLQVGLSALAVSERPRTTLTQARLVTAALMVPVTAVALAGLSVLRIFLVADLLATAAVVPALVGLWRRATPAGAVAGVVAGLAGAVLPQGLRAATFPDGVPTLAPFLWSLVASAVVTVVVSLVTGDEQSESAPAAEPATAPAAEAPGRTSP